MILENLEFNNWEFVEIKSHNIYYRLYYNAIESFFEFALIESTTCGDWDCDLEDSIIIIINKSVCNFDGIRHMYFNDYQNYPNIEGLILCLKELRRLELKYCDDPMYKGPSRQEKINIITDEI